MGALVLTGLVVGPLQAQRANTKDISAAATPATVTILTLDADGDTLAQGSGFFVSASGLLVTNWHVLHGATRAIVLRTNGPRYERVAFIGGDSVLDLAVLKVPGYGLPFLRTRQTTPSVGEAVTVIGSPLGFSATVSTGIVSALRTDRGRDIVQISAPISPGSSGGAVLDAAGHVFAVATWQARGGEQMNFAVPVRLASGWLTGTLSERSIASVFGTSTIAARRQEAARPIAPMPTAPRREARAAIVWDPLPVPNRLTGASPAISGAFAMTVEVYWDGLNTRVRRTGLLVVDELLDGYGLMVLGKWQSSPQDTVLTPITVSSIRSLRRTADGRVVLDDYGTPMSGFQTRDGFFLSGGGRDKDRDHFIIRTRATETPVALSENYGMYETTWKSQYWPNAATSPPASTIQWVGGAAVIQANDSIYVSVTLQNERGGSTSFESKGALAPDGSFVMTQKNGSWIKGSVHAGLLVAEFNDQRENGYFDGPLRATRK
jgi:hypothetical protein